MAKLVLSVGPVVAALMSTALYAAGAMASKAPDFDRLVVYGIIADGHGEGVEAARLRFRIDGREVQPEQPVRTSSDGTFEAEIKAPAGTLKGATVQLDVSKSSYRDTGPITLKPVLKERVDAAGHAHYLAQVRVTLTRTTSPALWIAASVLGGVYLFIAFELLHRTLAAFVGASLLLFITYTAGSFDPRYAVVSFEEAVRAIDMNVIFLLLAMMIIVGVLKRTGVFQWTAYKSFQIARGNVFVLSALLMAIAGVTSAFLDNVTTMLLIIPVTIEISAALKLDPVSLLLPEVFASNVGGTATLIGDPPNIMIGSYAGLSFTDFLANLGLVCAIALGASILYFAAWFRHPYRDARVVDVQGTIQRLREEYRIRDRALLVKSGLVLTLTILLFITHGRLDMPPSIAAMAGAALLLVISKVHIVEMLEKEIEWPTLIFFMMLFVVVAGAEQTGLIPMIADWVRETSGGSAVLALLVILWLSALLSAVIDNIPFTATMLPVVAYLSESLPDADGGVLWWALALGACLGGNATIIGASANVVTAGMAEKAGHRVSFSQYMRIGLIPTLVTLALCTLWLLLVRP